MNKISRLIPFPLALLVGLFMVIGDLHGQSDTLTKQEKRKQLSYVTHDPPWDIEIPIWIPGFVGEFSYGDVSIEGEDGSSPGIPEHPIEPPDPGEPPIGGGNIISRLFKSSAYLKFFFMNRVSYTPGKYIFYFDTFAGAVGDKVNFALNNKTVVEANFRTVLFRLYMGYQVLDYKSESEKLGVKLYAYAGGRFHLFHLDTQLGTTRFGFDLDPYWSELIVGIKVKIPYKRWLLDASTDMGGFYINEKFSSFTNLNAFFRISPLISVKLGWTDWRIKHRGTIKGETLYIRTHLSGPNTGVVFNF